MSRLIRVCFVASRSGINGVWTDTYNEMFKHARDVGVYPILVYPTQDTDEIVTRELDDRTEIAVPYRSQTLNTRLSLINYLSWWYDDLTYSKTIFEVVKNLDVDVFQLLSSVTCYVLKGRVNAPLVMFGAGSAAMGETKLGLKARLLLNYFEIPLERRLAKSSDHVVCVTEAVRDFYLKKVKLRPGSTSIVPWGVDTDTFRPENRDDSLIDKYGLRQRFSILSVGRVIPIKGFDILIRAIHQLSKRLGNDCVRLLIVGPSSEMWNYEGDNLYASSLRRYVKENHLEDVVIFTGPLRHDVVARLMASADVFALASRAEGMGLVILEAMASGRPVVASNVGGIPEVVDRNQVGFTFTPGDYDTLSDILLMLYQDASLREKIGIRAREASLMYTWRRAVASLGKIYASIGRG